MARYSLFVLKVPLNSNQPTNRMMNRVMQRDQVPAEVEQVGDAVYKDASNLDSYPSVCSGWERLFCKEKLQQTRWNFLYRPWCTLVVHMPVNTCS